MVTASICVLLLSSMGILNTSLVDMTLLYQPRGINDFYLVRVGSYFLFYIGFFLSEEFYENSSYLMRWSDRFSFFALLIRILMVPFYQPFFHF